jgi:hypothetical protein
MTARSGLSDLIETLRSMTDAGTGDYTLGTATFWDSDHLQAVLDRHRIDVYFDRLAPIPYRPGGGSVQYFEYQSRWDNFEKTTGGTAIFIVENGVGTDQGTADYSVDYMRGRVTFAADQYGTAYYVTGRSYDLNAAAADVWRQKASQAAKLYDVRTDNHGLSRSQIMMHCTQMAAYYANQGRANVIELRRGDMSGHPAEMPWEEHGHD